MTRINLPPRLRFAIYVLTSVGSLLVTYLLQKGLIGDDEVKLWTGLSIFTNGMAALNVSNPIPEIEEPVIDPIDEV